MWMPPGLLEFSQRSNWFLNSRPTGSKEEPQFPFTMASTKSHIVTSVPFCFSLTLVYAQGTGNEASLLEGQSIKEGASMF